MSDVDKEKWMKFIKGGVGYDFTAGNPDNFKPSQLIASDDIDEAYDSLFYEFQSLTAENEVLREQNFAMNVTISRLREALKEIEFYSKNDIENDYLDMKKIASKAIEELDNE